MTSRFCILFLAILSLPLLGFPTTAMSQSKSFWTPPSSVRTCGGSFSNVRPFELSTKIVRYDYPRDHGLHFTHYYGIGVSRTMAGRDVEAFKKYILSVAAAKTFTQGSYNSGNSPFYIQSTILKLTAMYITYMESKGLLAPDERETLIAWGKPMIKNQKQRRGNSAADSRAASGVALISWGSLTNDKRLIKAGQKNWEQALPFVIGSIGKLKRHPDHKNVPLSELSLEDAYNEALAAVVEGAAMLENLGFDAFNAKYKGRSVHDAIAWWTGVVATKPPGFKGYSRKSHTWTVAWMPIYLSKYPNNPVAGQMRAIIKDVTRNKKPMFESVGLGTATDCLWGYK
ncbi:hypothetical protein [uncultured Roseobacter sp.]|uniref:hypothetical protein n=1 Tax=uncultured Roseobacter sp. TaxID=114847 RepID=UPI00262ADE87|nr:hypothetical protein [uncultured Roseobacter sp.]